MSKIFSHANDNRESSDKEIGPNSPIFDTFYDDCGSITVKAMRSFKDSELNEIWMMVTDQVSKSWNTGRG